MAGQTSEFLIDIILLMKRSAICALTARKSGGRKARKVRHGHREKGSKG